jgi:hypothetical protein
VLRIGLRSAPAEPVHVHAIHRDVDLLGQLPFERHGLVHGHLLGQRDDGGSRLAMVDDERLERLRLSLDRANARDVREGPRRLQEGDALARGGAAVECCKSHLPSAGRPARRTSGASGRHEFAQLSVAAARYRRSGAEQQVAHRTDLERRGMHPRIVFIRVDGDAHRLSAISTS